MDLLNGGQMRDMTIVRFSDMTDCFLNSEGQDLWVYGAHLVEIEQFKHQKWLVFTSKMVET